MKNGLPWLLLSLLISANAHAQLYKWVDANGKISYSDTPPPSSVKKVEEQTVSTTGPSTSGLPFELAEAVKASPVTLYAMPKCNSCDSGRSLLNARGIPFAEKTVSSNEDIARLHQAGGDKQLPFLTIGRSKQSGFQADAWNTALTAAGYPETSQLPKTYRNPAPESAAQKTRTIESAEAANASRSAPSAPLPATGNAPPGFRF